MKAALLLLGLVVAALLLFILGLVPGERILIGSHSDSYVLIGIARFAIWSTGLSEFLLGCAFALGCMAIWRRVKTPKQ